MTASVIQICNLALARIRTAPIVSLTENTLPSRLCNLLYEPNRDATLEACPWSFATRRAMLALDATVPVFEYAHRFALPSDYLRIVRTDAEALGCADDYRIETGFLLCDDTTKAIEYIARETDTSKFSATFVDMFAERLAADLCIPLTDSSTMAQGHWEIYRAKLAEARHTDAVSAGRPRDFVVNRLTASRL